MKDLLRFKIIPLAETPVPALVPEQSECAQEHPECVQEHPERIQEHPECVQEHC
jgi:hypothetical protein